MMDDPTLLSLFARQFGVASTAQLRDAGVSRSTVSRAIERRTMHHVLPHVVVLNGAELTFEARAMAAVLHGGESAFVDGSSAGRIHGLRAMPVGVVELSLTRRRTIQAPGWLRVLHTSTIGPGDVVTHPSGLRVAHPRRMLLSLAARFAPARFARAAEDAWHLGLLTPSAMSEYVGLHRGRGVGGLAVLDDWITEALPRVRPSQSGLELDALDAIRRAGLPEPARQHRLVLAGGRNVHLDLAWPDRRLAVEPGHSWWHGGNQRMRADYARDRACSELGWQIVRFDESMRHDLDDTGRQLRRIYDARSATTFASNVTRKW